jgi:lysophospholipid acyltransferase (LPLAT)-like uncharacterized protein
VKLHNDPRAELRAQGRRYVFSVLHAHQVAAVIDGEKGTGAMVSRSADGQIIVPSLRVRGIVPVRGSGRGAAGGKGGIAALDALVVHVRGGKPAYLAVDGPRGPRGHVHKGIAVLAQQADAVVLNLVAVADRRWTLHRSWDKLQIPKPFSTIQGYFSEPLTIVPGESIESFRQRIEASLHAMEATCDPSSPANARPDAGQLAARHAA